MAYRASQPYSPLMLYSSKLHVVFSLQPKAASSLIRDALLSNGGKFREVRSVPQDATYFTFIRDPLKRSISGFIEIGDACSEVGSSIGRAEEVATPARISDVILRYEAIIGELEHRKCQNLHLLSHMSRMGDLQTSPLDFVGNVESMEADWSLLGRIQAARFGVQDWPPLATTRSGMNKNHVLEAMRKKHWQYKWLNVSLLRPALRQRVCTLYRDDYCCLRLPQPEGCSVSC